MNEAIQQEDFGENNIKEILCEWQISTTPSPPDHGDGSSRQLCRND